MFFFKSKKINLQNLNDTMSSVVNKKIKFDTKIEIPQNFVGLFYYKDKYIMSLNSGEYKFQGDLFYKLVEKNRKHNQDLNKQPKFDFNLHYVSTNNQNIKITMKKFVGFSKRITYSLNANYNIFDSKTFASHILLTWYKTTNDRTLSIINCWFKEFLEYCNSKKYKINGSLEENANKYFKKYGIIINNIKINSDNKIENNFFNNSADPPTSETIFQQQLQNTNLNISVDHDRYCPNCQSKLIEGSLFCHKCGYYNNKK